MDVGSDKGMHGGFGRGPELLETQSIPLEEKLEPTAGDFASMDLAYHRRVGESRELYETGKALAILVEALGAWFSKTRIGKRILAGPAR